MTGRVTLIDTMQRNLLLGGVVDEVAPQVPELARFPIFRLDNGIKFTSMFRKELPKASFTKLGDGVAATKGRYEEREFKLYLIKARLEIERAAAQADSEGLEGMKAREIEAHALASMVEIGQQIFYGTTNEEDGFPGLKAFTPFGGAYTYNAAGSTSSTASSVYGVKFGDNYARLLYGGSDTPDPLNLGEFYDDTVTGNNSQPLKVVAADMEGWIGLQLRHMASVTRICNLTEQTDKTLTDKMGARAIELLPTGIVPDVWFMSRRSLRQLRESRATPENKNPAMPTEMEGIPIVVTDTILNTDAIEA